ncbi:MAG: hypothetical protein M3406_10755, partial [Chloroflexota bacterium]|nr:hypothetical protein [Chloroflexota bacterium]
PYVRFEITCAHRDNVSDVQAGVGNPKVARTIKDFRFDNSAHFGRDKYEQVWLFGAESSYDFGAGWTNKPDDTELRAIAEFMDAEGGVFATGDHGALGSALCGFVPRIRSMRMWFAQPGPSGEPAAPDMNSAQRNDTNRPGNPPSVGNAPVFDFDDQSDDIPQEIEPKMYSRHVGPLRRVSYPHPLLCGRAGVIRVLPDHPHEGECIEPWELDREFDLAGYHVTEYPAATAGSVRPLPQVVATSRVLAGNNVKTTTVAQSFGAIGAYDGSLAGVGRVAVDATWHHFININLTGRASFGWPPDPKDVGFLYSTSGQAHYEAIKNYFRNLAVWLAPPASQACMRRCGIWLVIWDHRILEAVTPGLPLRLDRSSFLDVLWVGYHARDVLGRFAGQCQSVEWLLDLIRPIVPIDLLERLHPWPPLPDPDPSPWLDESLLLDLAIGGAVIALREEFPNPNGVRRRKSEREIDAAMERGARTGLAHGVESLQQSSRHVAALVDSLGNEQKGSRSKATKRDKHTQRG